MSKPIDTKAVLADCLPPNPANYKSDFQCMTMAIKRLDIIRAALAQEITRREVLEKALVLMTAERDALGSELLGHIGQVDSSDGDASLPPEEVPHG